MYIEKIGWIADSFFIVAYFLVSQKKITGHSKIFNLLNFVGAVLNGFYGWLIQALPLVVLELFWGGIALFALYRVFKPEPEKGSRAPSL